MTALEMAEALIAYFDTDPNRAPTEFVRIARELGELPIADLRAARKAQVEVERDLYARWCRAAKVRERLENALTVAGRKVSP